MKVLDPFRSTTSHVILAFCVTAAAAMAQNTGWRRVGDPPPNQTAQVPQAADPTTPVERPDQNGNWPADGQAPPPVAAPLAAGIPPALTIPAGTYITIRVNQPLSSEHNQVGDFFSGTLAAPVVVNGIVVAQRGQTVAGRVSQVEKGGHLKGVSKLGVELTELTAADGQQLPIQTQLTGQSGHSNAGRNVATVAGTTTAGAVIGTAADWGTGAVVGAGIGAAAGIAAVAMMHGAPAVIYPETALTFRLNAPVAVATDRAPQAFRYVETNDLQQPPPNVQYRAEAPPRPVPPPAPYYGGAYPYPYPYPYAYPYPYWGPGFGVVIGGPFYGGFYGGGFYRGGFYRGGFHRGWRR